MEIRLLLQIIDYSDEGTSRRAGSKEDMGSINAPGTDILAIVKEL